LKKKKWLQKDWHGIAGPSPKGNSEQGTVKRRREFEVSPREPEIPTTQGKLSSEPEEKTLHPQHTGGGTGEVLVARNSRGGKHKRRKKIKIGLHSGPTTVVQFAAGESKSGEPSLVKRGRDSIQY